MKVIYKSSYDKANRTSASAARGVGWRKAWRFYEVRERTGDAGVDRRPLGRPMRTGGRGGRCAANSRSSAGRPICCSRPGRRGRRDQREKGPVSGAVGHGSRGREDRQHRQSKRAAVRARASFGYNTLVSDMRSLPIMARTDIPVVFDATHSAQQPGGQGATSGGERVFAPVLARAALAVGAAAVFIETHQDPDRAPSDGPNMIPISWRCLR